MGDVVRVNFGAASGAPAMSCAVVSIRWNLDRSKIMVWLIVDGDRHLDAEIGSYVDHRSAVDVALAEGRRRNAMVIDHTAIAVGGIWDLTPMAEAIHINEVYGAYHVDIQPIGDVHAPPWIAPIGRCESYPDAVARARAASRTTGLLIVSYVDVGATGSTILGEATDPVPPAA